MTGTDADVLEITQEIPGGPEVDAVKEKEEPGSVMSSPGPAAAAAGSETVNKEDVGERGDGDIVDDVGIREESPEEALLKDDAVDTTKEATEEDNPEQICSAEPDVDSSCPERFISKKGDDRVRKRESRSLRYLKVPQASIVTQLKW